MEKNYTLNVLVEGYDESKAISANVADNKSENDWRIIYESRQNQTILQTEVTGLETIAYQIKPERKEKLCALVEIGDVRGMIPIDLLGVDEKQANLLLGEKIAFVVIGLDRENGIFTGSRIEATKQMAERALKRINVGDKILAVVRAVYNTNIVVDIGGIKSSIPASEASHGWIDNMHDEFKVGDHINVMVMEIDKEEREVKLSIKALQKNDWDSIHDYFKEYGEYVGTVSGIAEFGTYVTLRKGVSGLAQHLRHEVVKKGDRVRVRVLKIKQQEQRINLKIIKII